MFEDIANKILSAVDTWATIPSQIIQAITPLIILGLTIAIMWQGFNVIRGAGGQDHLLDVFFKSMRTFLVFSLCLAGSYYVSNVVELIEEARDWLTSLFNNSGSATTIYAQLDEVIDKTIEAFKRIYDYGNDNISIGLSSDFSGLVPIVGGWLMVLTIVLYCLVAALNLLIIEFSLGVILALGPLFVAALAFSATSSFFNTWLSVVLKYVLTAVIISAIIGLGTGIMLGFASNLESTNPETTDFIELSTIAVGSIIMLVVMTFKAASIGAELSAGAALQLASLARAAKMVASPTTAAAQTVGKVGGYAAGNAAGRVASSGAGQAVGNNRAMQAAMKGANVARSGAQGASNAMQQPSVMSATRSGFSSRASSGSGKGTVS